VWMQTPLNIWHPPAAAGSPSAIGR